MDELINLIQKVSIENENKNEIDINSNYFEFTELSIELDNLEYINIRKNALINNVIDWIKLNKNHTFPKRKHGWINAFRTQSNLLKTEIKYTPEQIINNIILKKTPKYMENICKKVYKIITNFNYANKKSIYSYEIKDLLKKIKIWCSLILDVDPVELYNILVENNILFIKGKYSLLNKEININNKKRKFNNDDIEIMFSSLENITNKVKKIKNL